jgi:hypothetical protein
MEFEHVTFDLPHGTRVHGARLAAELTGAKQGDEHTMAERRHGTEPAPTGDPITRGGRPMAQAADAARTVIMTVDRSPKSHPHTSRIRSSG